MGLNILQLEPQVIHELTIDTANGDRQFELVYGNLLAVWTDLWVTTVYEENQGELFHSIKELLGIHHDVHERQIIPLRNGGYIGFIDHPKQKLVTVHLHKREGSAIHREEFEHIIQATFSAIAVLTYEGYFFREISIPVIGKKGLHQKEYESSLKWFIHSAVNYLKFSSSTEKIKYYVHIKEDVPMWDQAITQLFAKNVMNPPNITLFSISLRGKIIELIESFPNIDRPSIKEVLDAINEEIKNNDLLDYSLLLKRADVLVDYLLKDLYKLGGISCPRSIPNYRLSHKQVAYLQKEEPIPDSFFNYLITIRILKDKQYFQTGTRVESDSDEKVLFLLFLQRILTFYQDFYKEFYER